MKPESIFATLRGTSVVKEVADELNRTVHRSGRIESIPFSVGDRPYFGRSQNRRTLEQKDRTTRRIRRAPCRGHPRPFPLGLGSTERYAPRSGGNRCYSADVPRRPGNRCERI